MNKITLSEILTLIKIIDNKEFKISGERQLILAFEKIRNDLVETVNNTFNNYNIDEKNITNFNFILTKEEENNE